MNKILLECGVILVLLVVNGAFAMTEIAVVSARKPRLRRPNFQAPMTYGGRQSIRDSLNRRHPSYDL